jgi:hypothetical protein
LLVEYFMTYIFQHEMILQNVLIIMDEKVLIVINLFRCQLPLFTICAFYPLLIVIHIILRYHQFLLLNHDLWSLCNIWHNSLIRYLCICYNRSFNFILGGFYLNRRSFLITIAKEWVILHINILLKVIDNIVKHWLLIHRR